MIEIKSIDSGIGISITGKKAPILLIVAEKGLLGCGYFSIETADKIGDALAIVSGVSTFEDVLNAEIKKVSSEARRLGIKEGISGREALKILS